MDNSAFVYNENTPGFFLAGLAGDPVRQRAEKIKSLYLSQNGETLLQRMQVEVPRRINYQSSGASHIPELISFYNANGADPARVAQAFKSRFPDLFTGSINATYSSGGSVASDPGASATTDITTFTTAGGSAGMNKWVLIGGAVVLAGVGYTMLKNRK